MSHGLPRDIQTFTDKLQQVLHDLGGQIISNSIKPASAPKYACRLIQRLNRNKEVAEGQKLGTIKGTMKVLGLSHKRAKKSDTRIA